MKEFFDFIAENWKILLAIGLAVANLLVCIFRKKVKIVDSVREFILDHLPMFISSAENLFSRGSDKKQFVLDSINQLLMINFNVGIDDYIDFVDLAIEKILSTPEKKGI